MVSFKKVGKYNSVNIALILASSALAFLMTTVLAFLWSGG
jgi:hypothetical protein